MENSFKMTDTELCNESLPTMTTHNSFRITTGQFVGLQISLQVYFFPYQIATL